MMSQELLLIRTIIMNHHNEPSKWIPKKLNVFGSWNDIKPDTVYSSGYFCDVIMMRHMNLYQNLWYIIYDSSYLMSHHHLAWDMTHETKFLGINHRKLKISWLDDSKAMSHKKWRHIWVRIDVINVE